MQCHCQCAPRPGGVRVIPAGRWAWPLSPSLPLSLPWAWAHLPPLSVFLCFSGCLHGGRRHCLNGKANGPSSQTQTVDSRQTDSQTDRQASRQEKAEKTSSEPMHYQPEAACASQLSELGRCVHASETCCPDQEQLRVVLQEHRHRHDNEYRVAASLMGVLLTTPRILRNPHDMGVLFFL